MRESEQKHALARIAGRYADGGLSRREFVRFCGRLGLGLSAAAMTGLGSPRPWQGLVRPARAQTESSQTLNTWLREVGGGYRGETVRLVSETTAPSVVIKTLAEREFTPLTGIEVDIELLPLERVLQRISLDVADRSARYDLYYLDQSWIARFADDTVDPREKYLGVPELAMPDYDWDDFLPALVDGISRYRGKMVGIPFDIPLFIMFYRRDLFEALGLSVPTTMDDYMATVQAIQAAKAPAIYGTTGQMKAGHYSLNCEWTAWLWAHGGSIFDADGAFTGGDEPGLQGLDYMLRLRDSMPPYVESWTWDGQSQSLLQGLAGMTLTWGEIFPATDDPSQSLVPGLMAAAPPPRAKALRPPSECGFGEIPNIGHQGGSALALSRYSERENAAWIFLQWATSREVQTQASLLGGGASPMRASVFDDPRIKAAARVQAGTTRHFEAVRTTIETAMGSEPDLPPWPEISNNVIPMELGRLLSGEHRSPEAAMAAIKGEADALAAPYRI
jgi:multiple sugar transport system substrate-binding protein